MGKYIKIINNIDLTSRIVYLNNDVSMSEFKKYKKTLKEINEISKKELIIILSHLILETKTSKFRLDYVLKNFDKLINTDNVNIIRYIKHSSTPETHLYI